MSVRVILGREAMLQQMNAQGPCYSSPKENLLHFSISSVGRLDHPQMEIYQCLILIIMIIGNLYLLP